MSLVWNGEELKVKMRAAAIVAIDETLEACVAESAAGHPEFPPASEPFTPYANRSGEMTDETKVLAPAHREGPWRISGSWGSLSRHALFLAIGTSVEGPTATERMIAAGGDTDLIAPEIGPLMARRHALIPAWDKQTRLLAGRIRDAFNA